MTAADSVVTAAAEPGAQESRFGFDIPPEMATRYRVRIVETPGTSDRRLGLFGSRDHDHPSVVIANNRIVARNADPEAIASLVKLAQHIGWDKIKIDGSSKFRKAIWSVATRAGLAVHGYAPTFADAERMEEHRHEDAARRGREAGQRMSPAADGAPAASAIASATVAIGEGVPVAALVATTRAADRQPWSTAPVEAREALTPDERVIIGRVFERGIRTLAAIRDPRAIAMQASATALVDQIYKKQENHAVSQSVTEQTRQPVREPQRASNESHQADSVARHRESGEMAELFLRGAADAVSADPRLSTARQAQTVMEHHIAEVFGGDAGQIASARLESRHTISDVIRRGLDISVRSPARKRQTRTAQTPELER